MMRSGPAVLLSTLMGLRLWAAEPTPVRMLCLDMTGLQSPTEVEQVLTRCQRMGINALAVEVYYYGRNVAYASDRFPQVQFAGDSAVFAGPMADQLAMVIKQADDRGMRVHATYNVAQGRTDLEGAVLQQHPDWQVQDWRGVRVPWMDMGQPKVRAYLRDLMTDVLRTHRLDGIIFDYIRYARPHWCCCDVCRAGFAKREGCDPAGLMPATVTGEISSSAVTRPTTAAVIARFEDGVPALATNQLGRGRVLVVNFDPFGAAEPLADAAARSALRAFGSASGGPIYLVNTSESEQADAQAAGLTASWMDRLEVPHQPLRPEQLDTLPAGSCALVRCLYRCTEAQARHIEAFVRAGGGLIWAMPASAAFDHPAVKRVLGFTEPARWSNRVRTIAAVAAASWLPGTEIPVARRGPLSEAWRYYRQQQITSLVAEVSREARRIDPRVMVSAFVMHSGAEADRLLQAWPEWVRDGLLDYAMPMSYWGEAGLTADLADWRAIDPHLRHTLPTLAFFDKTQNERPLLPDAALRQEQLCRAAGAPGLCWFSLAQLTPDIEAALQQRP